MLKTIIDRALLQDRAEVFYFCFISNPPNQKQNGTEKGTKVSLLCVTLRENEIKVGKQWDEAQERENK